MALSRDERAAKEAKLRAIRAVSSGVETFAQYVARVAPALGPPPPHLRRIYQLTEESRRRRVFATVSMPPRHGKSTSLVLGLGYRLTYDPAALCGYGTYAHDLSKVMSSRVRRLVRDVGRLPLSRSEVLDWETVYGGGLKATSVGGGITGRGIRGLFVVDDSLKGRIQAESLNERNRVWQWLLDDVMSRLEGGSSLIVVNTRWHEDDPSGRLQKDGLGFNWEHINLPAIGDENGVPVDEKEAPERARPLWTGVDAGNPTAAGAIAWYAAIRKRGEHGWWSLYQGVPRSRDSKLFREPTYFDPAAWTWDGKRGLLVLDPAATIRTSADYSALGAFSMSGYDVQSIMCVLEVLRVQVEIPALVRIAAQWQARYGLPIAVEAVAGFKSIPQMLRELDGRLQVIEIVPIGDKRTRAIPASDAWGQGRVRVPSKATWDVAGYIAEMRAFTGLGDPHDDQVDITAHAWNRLWKPAPAGDERGSVPEY